MTDDDPQDLAAGDEILQVMYWMRGEHIARHATASDLARMITTVGEARILAVLDRLAEHGLVRAVDVSPMAFELTEAGVAEGGRRFADEFSDLTKPGHGECGDPDCDCHRTGSTENCRHYTA